MTTPDQCAEAEHVASWREYMAENAEWQTERTPNVYARGFRDGMRFSSTLRASRAPVEPGVVLSDAERELLFVARERGLTPNLSNQVRMDELCVELARGAARATPPGELLEDLAIVAHELTLVDDYPLPSSEGARAAFGRVQAFIRGGGR